MVVDIDYVLKGEHKWLKGPRWRDPLVYEAGEVALEKRPQFCSMKYSEECKVISISIEGSGEMSNCLGWEHSRP